MSRKSPPVVLTEAEIIRLEQWIRAGSTPQQVVLRARIIVGAARGQTDLRITGDLRVQRRTVALWRQRVRELGIGCVWEMRLGRGRKTRYGLSKRPLDLPNHVKNIRFHLMPARAGQRRIMQAGAGRKIGFYGPGLSLGEQRNPSL